MFADEAVERDALVSEDVLDAEGSFLAVFAGHDLGAKGDLHFRSRPNAAAMNDLVEVFFKKAHIKFPDLPFSCASIFAAKDEFFPPALHARIFAPAARSVCESNQKSVARTFSFSSRSCF